MIAEQMFARSPRQLATDALEIRTKLIEFMSTWEGETYAAGFIGSQIISGSLPFALHPMPGQTDREIAATAAHDLVGPLVHGLKHAQTFALIDDVMTLIATAGETCPPVFNGDNLPGPYGFVVLPHPLRLLDVRNNAMCFRAFSWALVRASVQGSDEEVVRCLMMFWSNKHDRPDYWMDDLERNDPEGFADFPEWAFVHYVTMPLNEDEDFWRGLLDYTTPDGQHADWLGFVLAFFLLVNQRIPIAERQPADRGARRRAERGGATNTNVDVVILRRPSTPGKRPDGEPVAWSHRWMTAGHWRDQYYATCERCAAAGHSCKRHEPIWIAEFVKGPEDKPLVMKDRVFVWKR